MARAARPPRAGATVDARTVLSGTVSEAAWQEQVIAMAERAGWEVWHDRATNIPRKCPHCGGILRLIRNAAGLPDLLLWHPAARRFMAAELKSDAGKVTPAQQHIIDLFVLAGIDAYVWRPSMVRAVEMILSALAQPTPGTEAGA